MKKKINMTKSPKPSKLPVSAQQWVSIGVNGRQLDTVALCMFQCVSVGVCSFYKKKYFFFLKIESWKFAYKIFEKLPSQFHLTQFLDAIASLVLKMSVSK